METSERLAAYAAGELSPVETAAVEAALAGDASLRRQLAAIRHVDEVLAELPAVEPPAAFSLALRETLKAELAELAEHAPVIDLASRRRSRWMAPAAAVAAAAAVVVGGVQLSGLNSSSDDATESTALDMMSDEASGNSMDSMAADDAGAGEMSGQPVYAEGGSYDRDTLAFLADNRDILAARDAAAGDPSANQFAYLDRLSSTATSSQRTGAPQAESAPGIAADSPESDGSSAAGTSALGPINPVAACIPVILDTDRVPLFADLGTFEGASALIVVLGAPSPDGSFTRLEFWVLDPATCDVLHFAQR